MTVTGIIAEYNPFHNGHLYQIENARRTTGADFVVVVLSGNFTQRGFPAMMDKFSRTEMALRCGADIVFELPVCFSTGSAEYFAKGAVSLLNSLNKIDYIAFGSECGDLSLLSGFADIFSDESSAFKEALNYRLKEGISFPLARMGAVEELYPELASDISVLSGSNNILGIEYMKALKYLHSDITPITTQRVGSDYREKRLSSNFSSAISIRQSIENECGLYMIQNQVPTEVYDILKKQLNQTYPVTINDFSKMMQYKLISEMKTGYNSYYDVSSDLSDRIVNHLDEFTNISDFSMELKTKEVTYTRMCRALLHILLNLKQDDIYRFCSLGYTQYGRVLGFRKNAAELLGQITESSSIPIITKLSEADTRLVNLQQLQLLQDINASVLYFAVAANKYQMPYQNEYKRKLLKV